MIENIFTDEQINILVFQILSKYLLLFNNKCKKK